jgi:transcriptional regulator NrdR family protein
MICPSCEQSQTKVLETRSFRDPNGFFYVERARRCLDPECEHRYKTIELDADSFARLRQDN